MCDAFRMERDSLGELPVPAGALHGVHTQRALENFPLALRPVHPEFARAYGTVKRACAQTNRALGAWADDPAKADAIERACRELEDGTLVPHIVVDALQGGAGTSVNMNTNEVIANLALEHLGLGKGRYDVVHPNDHVNESQSTNDAYPSGFRIALYAVVEGLKAELDFRREASNAGLVAQQSSGSDGPMTENPEYNQSGKRQQRPAAAAVPSTDPGPNRLRHHVAIHTARGFEDTDHYPFVEFPHHPVQRLKRIGN